MKGLIIHIQSRCEVMVSYHRDSEQPADTEAAAAETAKQAKKQSLRKQSPHLQPVFASISENLSRASRLQESEAPSGLFMQRKNFSYFSLVLKAVKLHETRAERRQRRFSRSVCLLMKAQAAS